MNQRVEVIGTVDNDAAPASPGSAAEPSPELNVETVRMVAANCS
jgi:hypothetical protein